MQIKLEHINKIYMGKNVETAALRDINLTIEEGELLAIVGTSGSGKTTLLNIIGAMDRPSSGKYYFGEEEVSAYSQSKLHQFRKEKMGIADLKGKYPNQLSGGQKQRCAIARALAANTEVILADEPTGALDGATGQMIVDIFKEIHHQGKTVLIITHDRNVANQCERMIQIEDGKILES